MMRRSLSCQGLTLLELLTALVILSSVSAVAASVLNDGTRVMREAQLREQAIGVLEEWLIDADESGFSERARIVSDADECWSIRVLDEEAPLTPPALDSYPAELAADLALRVRWRRVEVWRDDGSSQRSVISLDVPLGHPDSQDEERAR